MRVGEIILIANGNNSARSHQTRGFGFWFPLWLTRGRVTYGQFENLSYE